MRVLRRIGSFLRLQLLGKWEPGWKTLLVTCLALGGLGTAAADWMHRQEEQRQREQMQASVRTGWPDFFFGGLEAGKRAPEFSLPCLTGERQVHLRDLTGTRPVVLIFGSFSCDRFCNRISDLAHLYQQFHGRAEFVWVYVQEAGHQIPGIEYVLEASQSDRPGHLERYREAIRKAMGEKGLTWPCVLDQEDCAVAQAYRGFPLALVLIGRDGRVACPGERSGLGWDLHTVETWLDAQTAG